MAEKTVFDQLGGTPQTPTSQPIQSAPPTSAATGTVFDQLGSSSSGGADLSFGGKPLGGTGTVFDQISSEPNTEGTVFHEDDRYALPGVMAKDANAPWYKLAWDYAWDVPLTEHLGIPAYRQGAGGLERGLEKFATGFTTPANLLLTIATYGAGGFIESAGATVLKESGVLTAEELTQVGAGAKKYVSALQEGYDATKAAEKAGVSPELMQKAVDGLYAHGLNEADMLGRPLTGRITGTFAKAGIPIEKAANVGKFLQAGASIGFSAQQAYGALQAVPAALDAVKEGDYDKALEYATEGTLSGFFAATGGRHALHDADTLLAPLSGGKLKPSEMTGKFLSLFKDRDESVGYANNQMAILQETLRDTLKKHLGRSPNEQEMVDYYTKMTVGEDPELARQMHNALAEAMGDPNRISPTGSSVLHQAHPITKNGNGQLSFGEDMFQQEHDRPLIMKANVDVDPRAKEIADAYEQMPHRPGDPAVRRTYESLKKDIAEQYKYATEKLGIKFEPSGADPYKNSAEMMADVRKNKTLKFFTGGDMPADHPMAEIMPGANITYNDAFRAIHDLYGHAAHGFEFGPRGEENAWNTHRQMFSPASVPALTTETKGQNSWVNFGPHMRDAQGNVRNIGEEGFIPASKRPYAEQKAGILPIEYWYRPDETAVAHHFSNVPGLDVIKTEKYGTNENIKSEDRKRMNEPGFKNRVYLGLDGRFYEHDIQAQRFKYRVPIDLKKFYDIEKDPQGIWAAARKEGATAAENAVEKAGYDGYYSQSQGIVASFKDMPVPQETSGAITTDGIRNSIQKAFPNVPSEQVEGVIALWKTFATSLGQPFAEFVHKNFIRFEHGGEPPASVGEALAQQGKSSKQPSENFNVLGELNKRVPVSSGTKARLLKAGSDPQKITDAVAESENELHKVAQPSSHDPREMNYLDCDICSDVLSQVLRYRGVPHDILLGTSGEGSSHVWIRAAGKDYDPTYQGTSDEAEVIASYGKKGELVAGDPKIFDDENMLLQTGKPLPDTLTRHLTADELAQVNKPNSKISLADVMKKLPPVKEFVEAAKAGAVGAKWYARSQAAFEAMRKLSPEYFKADDADRLAAVVAATSPQQPVAMNLREALTFWKQWHDAGRPLSEQDIAKAQKSGEIEKLANNATKLPAVIRALNDQEILSGNPDRYMKVTNFARNLSGMMDNVTNDTWMGIFGGIEGRIDKAAVYHAISSHVRAAAEELNISPAEAQASIWVFTKTLAEMAGWKGGENNSRYRPQELLSHLTNDKMAEYSRDFADIMRDDPEVRARLKELKVDVNELDKRLESIPRSSPKPIEAASNPHLGKAARRIGEAQQQLAGFGGYSRLPSKTTSFDFGVNHLFQEGEVPYDAAPAPTFFLKSEQVISDPKMPNSSSAQQWRDILQKQGVKAEEAKWTGLDDLLAGDKKLSRQQILDHLRANNVQVKDVELGGDAQNRLKKAELQVLRLARRNGIDDPEGFALDAARGELTPAQMDKAAGDFGLLTAIKDAASAFRERGESKLSPPKFTDSSLQLPGAQEGTYRELLLTLPYEKKGLVLRDGESAVDGLNRSHAENPAPFTSGHYGDIAPNVLAHVRFNTRIDSEGKRVLFMEEVQSDWHQKGRREGYAGEHEATFKTFRDFLRSKGASENEVKNPSLKIMEDYGASEEMRDSFWKAMKEIKGQPVPDAPFKKTWHELALKRMLRYAAENGYDKLAWTPGEVQNDRYDLSKHIDKLTWSEDHDGKFNIQGEKDGRQIVTKVGLDRAALADHVGKDAAEKIANHEGSTFKNTKSNKAIGVLSGIDLKVGGSGMKGFYDKMIPEFLNKYGKKWGAKVGETGIATGQEYPDLSNVAAHNALRDFGIDSPQYAAALKKANASAEPTFEKSPSIEITPQMKKSVMGEGQPLFQKGSGHVIKGATEFMKDGSAVIRGYKSGDISTLIHETFHVFRRHIPQVESQLAEKIYGVQNGTWTREQEEKFAEDGTKYVHEGKSPIPEMDGVFAKLKTWLSDLYHKLMSSPKADDILPSEKRQLFDRMFGARGTDREYSHPSMPDNIRELMAKKAVDPQQGNMLREAYKRVHQNKFSDVENSVMKQVREKMASGYEFAHNRGIIRQAVDNYLPRIFEKQNPSGNAVSSEARQGKFATSATYARHRVFQSELEASLLGNRFAAFDPIALMGKWHGDIQRIAANRELLDKLRDGGVRGSDGRPAVALSGMGRVAEGPNGENPVTMVHPNRIRSIKIAPTAVEAMKTSGELDRRLESGDIEEINTQKGDKIYVWRPQDYESMNHQAFRGWNYVTSDPSGHPVMMDAEMKVHPEYAKYLKRRLGLDDSPLRNWAPTRGLLKASTEAKHLMLSFSPFHMFQEGLRGIMMGVNPFLSERVDFAKDSRLKLLMRNGATLETDHQSLADHSEGLASHSKILSKVPIIGKSLDWYQHFLFERYIPSLKARTGVKLYEQYRSMHPDWTKDMAASHAAREINDVFGGQNWREMGRSTATQDWFRILALAPDWLESEARFAARLFSPTEGVIARKQTVKLALGLWGVSRVLNMMMTGKPHYEAPFGIVRKDDDGREKVYSMRTLPTDIMHMASDPIGFVRGRMSPFAHSATEAWTGRDQFGKKLTPGDLTADIFANMSPIPAQTAVKKIMGMSTPPTTNSDQAVKAAGLTVTPYRTQAQKLAAEISSNHNESGPVDSSQLARHQAMIDFEDKLRAGKMRAEDLHSMVEVGQMSPLEAKKIIKVVNDTKEMPPEEARLYMRAANMPMRDLLDVWEKSTQEERIALSKLFHKKAMTFFKKSATEMSSAERMSSPTYRRLRLILPSAQPF